MLQFEYRVPFVFLGDLAGGFQLCVRLRIVREFVPVRGDFYDFVFFQLSFDFEYTTFIYG